jgi:predicted nucleotide-binding protein
MRFKVTAYETGPRVGLHIADILEKMEDEASFAILVMTGENEDKQGLFHARDNVIHEVGLFQGRLGFKRAIVLLEEGCAEFSNLSGVQYLPLAKGNIKETFGEVLATLKREFEGPT